MEYLPAWMFLALTILLMAGFPVTFTLLGTALTFGNEIALNAVAHLHDLDRLYFICGTIEPATMIDVLYLTLDGDLSAR